MYNLWQAHNSQQTELNNIPENLDDYFIPALGQKASAPCIVVRDNTQTTNIGGTLAFNSAVQNTTTASINSPDNYHMNFECEGNVMNSYTFLRGDVISDTINGSQTITHKTEGIGELTPGLFCESIGEIYYMKPRETSNGEIIPWCAFEDAITKIKKAESLNKNIIGIITHTENEFVRFATHGDILIRVIPGSYSLGDIIVPTAGGLGKKATSDEIMNCITLGVPRVKITATTTKFSDCVAGMIL